MRGLTPTTSPRKYGQYAHVDLSGTTSNYLVGSYFGFSIPTGATILGIQLSVLRAAVYGLAIDAEVRLVKAGTIQTTDRSRGGAWSTSFVTATYGGPTDLWGTTWAASDINSSGFGAAIAATVASGSDIVDVD